MEQRTQKPQSSIGWPLWPTIQHGKLSYPGLEESIKQRIKILLLTQPGEQLMHPEFGIGLDEFVHLPNTLSTRKRIHDRIINGLARWERRIVVNQVQVAEVVDQPEAIRIGIYYRIKRSGNPVAMNLTLRLGS